MFSKLKQNYLIYSNLLPTIIIKRALHILFLGPIRPSWTIEFTLALTWLSYIWNVFPVLGLQLSRFIQNNFSGFKYWECEIISFKVPKLKTDEVKGFLKDFFNGTSEIYLNTLINCEFLIYKPESKQHIIRDSFQLLVDILFPKNLNNTEVIQCIKNLKSQTELSRDSIILYIHGGGFMCGSMNTHRMLVQGISKACKLPIFHLDYGLAPDNQYPSALFEIFSAYKYLTDTKLGLGYRSDQVFLSGDSAGGNLALSFAYYLRDFGFDIPRGHILLSPWLDLTQSHPSWNGLDLDYLSLDFAGGEKFGNHYAPNQLENPYVSPYYGRISDLGPMLIQFGEVEKLSGEIKDFGNKFESSKGSQLRLECYRDMPHVFQIFSFDLQSTLSLNNIRKFIDDCYNNNTKSPKVSRATYPKLAENEYD